MSFTTLDFGTLSISSNGVGVQTIFDSGSLVNDLSTSSKSKSPKCIADMNLAISKVGLFFRCIYAYLWSAFEKKRARAVSASDENTPPSKKRVPSTLILASHRRFASMPLQTLLSGTDGWVRPSVIIYVPGRGPEPWSHIFQDEQRNFRAWYAWRRKSIKRYRRFFSFDRFQASSDVWYPRSRESSNIY